MLELMNLIRSGKKSFTGEEVQKLLASDGVEGDNFGYTVAISGDGSAAVVGARYDDDKGSNSGSVYVFIKQPNGNYVQSQKLLASDGAANDNFSMSLAINSDGSVIAVGSPYDADKGNYSGSVYVFTKQSSGSYAQSQKLTASDGAEGDRFGISVVVSSDGSVITVGAHYDDDKGSNSGSAYVFAKQLDGVYVQSQKLTASDGAANDYFGQSVTISNDGSVVVVGAYADDDKGVNSGSAYVFTKQVNGNYLQSQKLIANDGTTDDCFGYSVAISGDGSTIAVGAYGDDDKGVDSGSAYVFTKQSSGNYVQSQKLLASDGANSDRFGISLVISDDGSVIVAGAYYDDDKGADSGSAYVFTKQVSGDYAQSQKLTAFDGADGDRFGRTVAVNSDGSVVLVGAYYDDDKVTDSGSVYIFK